MPVVALTCAWCFEFRQSEPLLPSLPTITDKGRPFPAAPKILYRSISNAEKQLCKGQTVPNLRLYTSRPLQYILKAVIKKGPHEQPQSWRCEHNLRTPTSKHLPRGPAILLTRGARADLGTTKSQSRGLLYPHKLLCAYGHWRKRELLQYLRGRVARCHPHRQNHHRRHTHRRPVNNRVSLDAPRLIWSGLASGHPPSRESRDC